MNKYQKNKRVVAAIKYGDRKVAGFDGPTDHAFMAAQLPEVDSDHVIIWDDRADYYVKHVVWVNEKTKMTGFSFDIGDNVVLRSGYAASTFEVKPAHCDVKHKISVVPKTDVIGVMPAESIY